MTNEKIAWITDTSALIGDDFIEKYQIHVLPINIIFPEGAYRETIDLSQSQFYEKMRNTKASPSTSQPIYGEMVELYKRLKNEGYSGGIAVHPTSLLSNTYHSSISAAKEADFELYAIDSKIVSFPMMKMIKKGYSLYEEGVDIKTIVKTMEDIANRAELTGIPANLNQLHKSGRVPGIAAFIGNLLNLKIIVSFQDGRVGLKEKVRTINRAKMHVMDYFRQQVNKYTIDEVAVVHCNNEKDAQIWKGELQKEFPSINFIILPISACIAVHTGEGTTGLSWVYEN